MQSTIWTIALISVGIVTPNIQHMGYFLEEKDCKQALVELKSQDLGLKIKIPISPDFETILESSTNLNQWTEQQRFGRQSNMPSIVVPLKMDQTKSMEYWRTRNQ